MKQLLTPRFISAISIILISCFPIVLAQQPYINGATALCDSRDNSTSVLGYTCNGPRPTCQAYLTFRAQPPYTSVSTISTLLSVNSSQLSQLNSVPENTTFQTNKTVLIPVTCSCSGEHYQSNASYVVRQGDTYLAVASNTFQGLSTCQALQAQNKIPAQDLFPGASITVPLRCACPTRNQSGNGVNYLLSYLIAPNQFISTISERFGASTVGTLAANGLSETDIIYPSTTLLVPLHDPPTSSQVTAPPPPPPPPPSSATPTSSRGSSKTWIYTLVGVAGGLFLVGAVIFSLFFLKKKKKKKQREDDVFLSSQSFESVEKPPARKERDDEEDSRGFLESISSIAQSLKVYTFEELRAATEDFSPNFLIKGSVYCGTINGDSAAVKKMIDGDVSGEIGLLNKLNHFNLIRLSGVGFNEGIWYLVYEYASNGSLHDWIIDKSEEKTMDWDRRLQVAMDIAAGLNYLHRYASPPYVHKNLNSNNVLLDRDLRAKIANFGRARSAESREGQFALTRHVVGTKGYMAPEYLENGVVSPELDVYAFGVILMEILTGKEVSLLYAGVNIQLSEILTPVLSEDDGNQNLRKLMDPMLQGKYPPDLALVLFGLVGSCLKKDPSDRPSMDDIFKSLSKISTSSSSMSSE